MSVFLAHARILGILYALCHRFVPSRAPRRRYNATCALLTAGANTNLHVGGGEQSLLEIVIRRGFMHILQAILEHGVDANYGDSEGRTALHFAASDGNAESISILVRAGANVNAKVVDMN